jgi:hypothetical protein
MLQGLVLIIEWMIVLILPLSLLLAIRGNGTSYPPSSAVDKNEGNFSSAADFAAGNCMGSSTRPARNSGASGTDHERLHNSQGMQLEA